MEHAATTLREFGPQDITDPAFHLFLRLVLRSGNGLQSRSAMDEPARCDPGFQSLQRACAEFCLHLVHRRYHEQELVPDRAESSQARWVNRMAFWVSARRCADMSIRATDPEGIHGEIVGWLYGHATELTPDDLVERMCPLSFFRLLADHVGLEPRRQGDDTLDPASTEA